MRMTHCPAALEENVFDMLAIGAATVIKNIVFENYSKKIVLPRHAIALAHIFRDCFFLTEQEGGGGGRQEGPRVRWVQLWSATDAGFELFHFFSPQKECLSKVLSGPMLRYGRFFVGSAVTRYMRPQNNLVYLENANQSACKHF